MPVAGRHTTQERFLEHCFLPCFRRKFSNDRFIYVNIVAHRTERMHLDPICQCVPAINHVRLNIPLLLFRVSQQTQSTQLLAVDCHAVPKRNVWYSVDL